MSRAQISEKPMLYGRAANWSMAANTLDEEADCLAQAKFAGLAGDARKAAEVLRTMARMARTLAGEAE